MKLDGKFALVTGGGSGIGREICLTFAREGAHVAVNDVRPEGIKETIRAMGEAGARALPAPADVADSAAVEKMVGDVLRRYGALDILVNNAGIGEVGATTGTERLNRIAEAQIAEMMAGGPIKTHWEVTQSLDDPSWDRMVRVHLYGTFHCMREALKVMEPRGYGRILNISSIAATVGLEGAPHYCAAKAGILGLTYSCAVALGKYNVTCNAIMPGAATRMTDTIPANFAQSFGLTGSSEAQRGPMDPSNVAPVVVFLGSDEAQYVNGQVIGASGYRISLYSHLMPEKVLCNQGPWDLDQLSKVFKSTLGADLKPPKML